MMATKTDQWHGEAKGEDLGSVFLDGPEITRRIEALLPEIRERSQEFENARRIPLDMVNKLRDAGCFRLCVPSVFGGAELDIIDRLHLLSVLAQADGSVGWTVAIANSSALIAIRASRQAVEEIYRDSPDTVIAGSAGPQGTAEKVDGGYRISGRWGWASGSLHAQWLQAQCIFLQDGKPVRPAGQEAGPPLMKMALIPQSKAEIIDTWQVVGLSATGSNDFVVNDLFVPESQMLDFFLGQPCVDGPVYRSYVAQAGLMFASLALGIARGALADTVGMTQARKQRLFASGDMSASEIVQMRLGNAHSTLEAATIALHGKARQYVAEAEGLPIGPQQLKHPLILSCAAMGTWVVRQATDVVEMAYDAGGGSSVWRSATLQRRLRDIKTLTSHVQFSDVGLVNLGKGMIEGSVEPLWTPAS